MDGARTLTRARSLSRAHCSCRDRITSLSVSSDCRWLLSASLDGTVRVWDVPAGQCLQAMAMGSPVTSLSLSPGRDLLATTHAHKRGVFLWSNQLMFGDAAGVALNADRPVPVALPSIATGAEAEARRGGRRRGEAAGGGAVAMAVDGEEEEDLSSDEFLGGGASSSSDDDGSGDEAGARQGRPRDGRGRQPQLAAGGGGGDDEAPPAYARTAAAGGGAPVPLSPELVTLSLLPRAQWETLLHLDAIKARSKPIQPPKKPEAAPFFLPTVPGLEGNPVFDTATAAGGEAAAAAGAAAQAAGKKGGKGKQKLAGWGDSDDEEGGSGGGSDGEGEGEGAGAPAARAAAPGSRVVRTKPTAAAAPVGTFLRLLRACGDAGDFSSFMGHVRGLSPAALDRELRSMVLLEGASEQEVADVALLLQCLEGEVAAARNYEFCQALLQHVLAVRGRWEGRRAGELACQGIG